MSEGQGTAARGLWEGKVQTPTADRSQAELAGLEETFRTDKRGRHRQETTDNRRAGEDTLHSDVCVSVCKTGKPTSR